MIEVRVAREQGAVCGFLCVRTETEIAEEIAVASSVVTILHTAVLGLVQVAGAEVELTDEPRKIELTLPSLSGEVRWKASVILDTMLCGLSDLAAEFSDFLSLEVN